MGWWLLRLYNFGQSTANGEYLSNVIKGNFLYVQPFSRLTVKI